VRGRFRPVTCYVFEAWRADRSADLARRSVLENALTGRRHRSTEGRDLDRGCGTHARW
jgi:hypothetical protein